MTNRTYRLWDYTPSHAQLLLRSVADDTNNRNDDLLFSGVRHIDLPESIVDPGVREATAQEVSSQFPSLVFDPDSRPFLIEGTDPEGRQLSGYIIAESFQRQVNELDSYDSSLRQSLSNLPSSNAYEKQVLAALARIPGLEMTEMEIGVDAVLSAEDGRLIAVEVKRMQGSPTPRTVRNIVTQLVVAMNKLPTSAHAIVILNGADEGLIREVTNHLVTALYGRATALEWRPEEGSPPLQSALGALAA